VAEDVKEVSALVQRARNKDQRAGEDLFRLFGSQAYRLALRMTGGHVGDAEDLVQDAFLTCLRQLDDLRDPPRFCGWLLRTVRNLAINRYRARQTRSRLIEQLTPNGLQSPSDAQTSDPWQAFAQKQRQELVREVFNALPDGPAKKTAQLYYFEGFDNTEEVARKLDIPKSTVTTRLERFRAAMRKRLIGHLARGSKPASRLTDLSEVQL